LQGIEFDYCCCHASFSLRDAGFDTIMMNSNPETVSTDYDTSSRLYFEPLTLEDVLNVVESERPDGIIVQVDSLAVSLTVSLTVSPTVSLTVSPTVSPTVSLTVSPTVSSLTVSLTEYPTVSPSPSLTDSRPGRNVVVQFGGQTPLKLAKGLDKALKEMQIPTSSGDGSIVKIWGTSPDAIDEAEDRERFEKLLKKLDIAQPPGFSARSEKEALEAASKIGYPVMVRPSHPIQRCQYTVCCSTSCWTIWGGGHRCVVGCQYTVCCSTSCWTIWGGGHRCVKGC
jgi:carbamoyl-phosphate synthase large subunit